MNCKYSYSEKLGFILHYYFGNSIDLFKEIRNSVDEQSGSQYPVLYHQDAGLHDQIMPFVNKHQVYYAETSPPCQPLVKMFLRLCIIGSAEFYFAVSFTNLDSFCSSNIMDILLNLEGILLLQELILLQETTDRTFLRQVYAPMSGNGSKLLIRTIQAP